MGIIPPDDGADIELDGHALAPMARRRESADQKALQIVFQNPDRRSTGVIRSGS